MTLLETPTAARDIRAVPAPPPVDDERTAASGDSGPIGLLRRLFRRPARPTPDPIVLSADAVASIGRELDALREREIADLGTADVDYIERIVAVQRRCEIAGRALFFVGFLPPAWLAGVAALSVSKILDNMEIGHNVMHGQYDFTREESLDSRRFEWDTACPADQWRHSHNYVHHTYTNILGEDRDIGYGILRMDTGQKWHPYYLGNPVYAFALMMFFEWGVMLHDAEVEKIARGERGLADLAPLARQWWRKAGRQVLKDYVLFPIATGPLAIPTLVGNATANLVRNVWAFSVIFCGHFPSGVQTFTIDETRDETRGEWYVRQMLGSANFTGGPLLHLMSGNLSYQIEHHLFPDLPAWRYAHLSSDVRAICERHELPYNTGGLGRQIATVWRKIVRLSVPWGRDEPTARVVLERPRDGDAAESAHGHSDPAYTG